MRDRLYLINTYVTPFRFVTFRGEVIFVSAKHRFGAPVQLLDLWNRSAKYEWIIFEYRKRFHAMHGSNVVASADARLFIDDYLVFDGLDAAIAAAVLS